MEPLKYFVSEGAARAIESGQTIHGDYLWGSQTEYEGTPVYWLGARPDTWLVIADLLLNSGTDRGQVIADGIAYRFGMSKRNPTS